MLFLLSFPFSNLLFSSDPNRRREQRFFASSSSYFSLTSSRPGRRVSLDRRAFLVLRFFYSYLYSPLFTHAHVLPATKRETHSRETSRKRGRHARTRSQPSESRRDFDEILVIRERGPLDRDLESPDCTRSNLDRRSLGPPLNPRTTRERALVRLVHSFTRSPARLGVVTHRRSISFSLGRSLSLPYTHFLSLSHTHTPPLSVSFRSPTLSLSLSLSSIHALSFSFSLSFSSFLSLALSL